MRIRIRALIAVLGIVVVRARSSPRRRSRPTTAARPQPLTTEAVEQCFEKLAKGGDVDRRLPEGAEPDAPGEERDHLGHRLSFVVLLVRSCGSSACPPVKNMDAGPRGPDPRRPREARRRPRPGRGREGAVPRAARRRHATRPAGSSRRPARRPSRCASDLIARAEAEAHEIRDAGAGRHRGAAASGRWPTCRTDVADALDRARRADRRAQPRPRHAARSSSTATSTRSGATEPMADRIDVVRAGAARHRRGRRAPRRGRGRAVPLRAHRRGQRRPAHDARRTRGLPRRPAGRRSSTSCSRTGRCRARAAIAAFIVGAGRGHDLPAIVDRFVELAAAEREHEVAEVRSRGPLDDAQSSASPTALSQATGKQVEVKVIVDETVLGGIVATHRRHRDRRHGPSPSRPAEGDASKWRSSPSTPTTSPRRCASTSRASGPTIERSRSAGCSRSATASPASPACPNAAVNELLEFEGGALGLALNLDEDTIGAVVLGKADEVEEGQLGQGDRPHPLGARRRRAASAGS